MPENKGPGYWGVHASDEPGSEYCFIPALLPGKYWYGSEAGIEKAKQDRVWMSLTNTNAVRNLIELVKRDKYKEDQDIQDALWDFTRKGLCQE